MLAPATAARLVRSGGAAARPVARRRPAAAGAAAGVRPGPARPSGRPWRRPARSPRCSRSGSGSGCCRTPRPSTGSPSTGTSSRPASRRRALIRDVSRPDVLVVAALLHDIGKGGLVEHSVAGEPIARAVATRMGFDAEGVDLVAAAGALAPAAGPRPRRPATRRTRRPSTWSPAASGTPRRVALLLALTEADARATAPKAWSAWRAGLVRRPGRAGRGRARTSDAARRARDAGARRRRAAGGRAGRATGRGRPTTGVRVTVVAPDRVGLLADVAAMFALQRATVRAARGLDRGRPRRLRVGGRRRRWWTRRCSGSGSTPSSRAGSTPPRGCGRTRPGGLDPTVVVRPEASRGATVLEVRAADRPGVLYLTLRRARHASTSASARRTSTPSGRRRSTSSTSRSRGRARSPSRGPPRPPTPYARCSAATSAARRERGHE